MKIEIKHPNLKLDSNTEKQIHQCLSLIKETFRQDLLGVYLYGSAMLGGLQKYSDIDLFVVLNRPTTYEEKTKLISELLQISGVYMKSTKLPVEITIVLKAEITPWHYPPKFDFQYGDWLRNQFESGNIEPWKSKVMTNLALMITQLLLRSKTLFGVEPDQLLPVIPYRDFITATTDELHSLMADLDWDIRNVLLTLARIWSTVATDSIRSKPAAADWVINYLPEKYRPVMQRAKAICKGEETEYWDDIRELIKPCADFMLSQINNKISEIQASDYTDRSIKLALNKEFTSYLDINEILEYFQKNISAILAENFIGMYLYGSLATGDFDPDTSDIDFIVITKNHVSEEQFLLLDKLHKQFHSSETKWAKKIEAAYITKDALGKYEIDSTLYPQIEKEREFAREKLEMGWPIQCYILREHGIVISGPDPKTLLKPVELYELLKSAKFIAELWYQQAQDKNESAFLREETKFVIMTLCRFLFLLHTNKIGTKLSAVQWAKENLDKQWVNLIDQILFNNAKNGIINFDNVVSFIKYTVDSF